MKRFWASVLAMLVACAMLATGAWAEFGEVSDAFEPEVEEVEEFLFAGEEDGELELEYEDEESDASDATESVTEEVVEDEESITVDLAMAQAFNTYTVHGKQVAANSVASPGDGQCWEYANKIYNIIWGVRFDSSFTGSANTGYNTLRNLSQEERKLTAEHIRDFIGASELGAVIRITACNPSCPNWGGDGCAAHNYGHNLVLVAKSSGGFTTFDNWEGAVREKTWTWSSFYSAMVGKYPNVKYIKWPNAIEFKKEGFNLYPSQPALSVSPANDRHSTIVSWETTQNTTYYDIHIRDAKGNVVIDDTTGKNTSYTTKLPVGVYYVYVGAVNTNADEWKATDSSHVWFGVSEYNAIPGKVKLCVTATDNLHETVFSWDRVENADHYDVHLLDAERNSVVSESVGVDTQFKTYLKSGTYTAYIGAVNAYADEWKWNDSDRVSITVKNGYAYPEKPVLVVKATTENEDVEFLWNSTANTTYYDLHICDSSGTLIATDTVGKSTNYKKRFSAGTYWAYVGAVNTSVPEWTTKDSDRVKFIVTTYNQAHTHVIVEDRAIAATCTSAGKTSGSHCSVCGEVINSQQIIPATGHTPVTVKGKAATCTVTGLTDGTKCSVCGVMLTAQQTIAKTAHTPVTVKGKAATCTATGLTDGSKCSVCGVTLTAQQTIAKKAHTPVTVKGMAATCTQAGLTDGSKCSVCGVTLTAQQTIAKKAHTPVTVKGYAATYERAGLTDGTKCSVCGAWITPQKAIAKLQYPTRVLDRKKSNGTVTVNLGDKIRLVPQFATAAGASVTGYKSGKAKVAAVDGSGLVTALAEGKAKITVTTNNKKVKATITVVVVDPYKPTGISIKQGKTLTMTLGQSQSLTAVLEPGSARSNLTWKTSKAKVVAVDGNGKLTALAEGKAKITVTTNNKKVKATITVVVVDPYKPTGISITQGKTITLKVGQSQKLGTTLEPGTARSERTWKSSKPAVATVDASGNVKALKKGKAKITVTTYNKKKATITVVVTE